MNADFGIRWKFHVAREDYDRRVTILITREDADGGLALFEPRPVEHQQHAVQPAALLRGYEPSGAFFTKAEAQQLFDAMYEQGFRPTRR